MQRGFVRYGTYTVPFIWKKIRGRDKTPDERKPRIDLDGHRIRVTSARIRTFRKNLVCVKCGLRGTFFAKEGVPGVNPHINLYGVNEHGHEILMTKDHIIPRSKGGSNVLNNLQTMCVKCNGKKGSTCEVC